MTSTKDLSDLPAYHLKEWIQQKKITPIEVVDFFLQKIERLNPKLNALLYINDQNAKNYARKFTKLVEGNDFSRPLLGVPLVVPDPLNMKGTPTTYGSLVLEDNICEEDQVEITLLKNAGAIILGKTNMAEFRLSFLTQNHLIGPCHHPSFPEYSPGGPAAGGGAAVVGGLSPLALSVDMGGSLRVNSSFCDLIGLTPTRGRVPTIRSHLLPYSEKMFYRKGIVAKNIRDVTMMLDVISQPDNRDPLCTCKKIDNYQEELQFKQQNLKIAWCPNFDFLSLDLEVSAITMRAAKAFEEMGHHVEEYRPKFTHDLVQHFLHIIEVDRFILIMNILRKTNKDSSLLTDYAQEFLKHGDRRTGVQYSLAVTYAGWVEQMVSSLFKTYDLLILPTCPILPYRAEKFPKEEACSMHKAHFMQLFGHTCAFNMSGHPAISVPCGHNKEGLPVGLQLVGPHFAEGHLLCIAKDFLMSNGSKK